MLGKEVLGAPLGIQFISNVFSLVEVRAQYRTFQFRPQRIVGKSLLLTSPSFKIYTNRSRVKKLACSIISFTT